MEYMVYLEAKAPEGIEIPDCTFAGDTLMDKLADHSPSVGEGRRTWNATIAVEAHDAIEAVRIGGSAVSSAAADAGMPDWPWNRIEVRDYAELEDEFSETNFPDVVGSAEVQEMLGVSRERLRQLRAEDREPPFPLPARELAATPLWPRAAITAYLERWDRTPGRRTASFGSRVGGSVRRDAASGTASSYS